MTAAEQQKKILESARGPERRKLDLLRMICNSASAFIAAVKSGMSPELLNKALKIAEDSQRKRKNGKPKPIRITVRSIRMAVQALAKKVIAKVRAGAVAAVQALAQIPVVARAVLKAGVDLQQLVFQF